MSWLAASLLVSVLSRPVFGDADRVMQRVAESTLRFSAGGSAVMIDRGGYFMVHRSFVNSDQMVGENAQHKLVALNVVVIDEISQTALLKARTPEDIAGMVPVTPASRSQVEGQKIYALLSTGLVSGDFGTGSRPGVFSPGMRVVPVCEIHLEARSGWLGGALVFEKSGQFVGLLSATLEPAKMSKDTAAKASVPSGFGPKGLTVGYSLGLEVWNRVITGYRSPSHTPQHPTLGCFFKDAPQGVVVTKLVEGGAAARAGIETGDILTELNGQPIHGAVDLGAELFQMDVGDEVRFAGKRGTTRLTITAKLENYRPTATFSPAKLLHHQLDGRPTLVRIRLGGEGKVDERSWR